MHLRVYWRRDVAPLKGDVSRLIIRELVVSYSAQCLLHIFMVVIQIWLISTNVKDKKIDIEAKKALVPY